MKTGLAIFVILCAAVALFRLQGTPTEATSVAALIEEYADGEISLADLPVQQAIKQVHGNGTQVLVTFEDPNCPYCAELDKKLSRFDDITLYTFLLPVLSPDSEVKSRRIWCATDRAAAWKNWMVQGQTPTGTEDCDTTALTKNLEIGERLGIRGVPYLLQVK
jgi:thiol:disulfide interchange protein DsbC